MFRFTIRELILLTVIVAMGAAWWVDRRTASIRNDNLWNHFLRKDFTLSEISFVLRNIRDCDEAVSKAMKFIEDERKASIDSAIPFDPADDSRRQ